MPSRVALPPLWWAESPNQSSRHGQRIRGVVVHETQGGYAGAVSWLRNPAADASAHVVLSEDGSKCTQLVPWSRKAWHAANANSYTLGLELAGYEGTKNDPRQLARAARIVAWWCQEFGIPVAHQSMGMDGICRHEDLGAFGGGHHDPGGFDWDYFLGLVRNQTKLGGFRARWGRY